MYFCKFFVVLTLLVMIIPSISDAAQVGGDGIKYSWIQLAEGKKRFLRVISTSSTCPKIVVDNKEKHMQVYSEKDKSFNVVSCIYEINPVDKNIKLGTKLINVVSKKIGKILVIADTGCVINPVYVQDCRNDWYFKELMEVAMSHKPDLIIHVGDYHYRDSCLMNSTCRYENTGDNFRVWEDDFFRPASNALLGDVPWIFVRGNHEGSKRAVGGWARFFDFGKHGHGKGATYFTNLDGSDHKVAVLDSSDHHNDISALNGVSEKLWVLTHIPFEEDEFKKLPKNVTLTLSGHLHKLRVTDVSGVLSAVVGNGGAKLDQDEDKSSVYRYGFVILDKVSDGWLFTARDYGDTILVERKVLN